MNMRYSDGEYNHGKQSWDFVKNNHFERDYRMSKGTKKGKNNGIAVLVIFMVIGFAMAIGGIVMTVDIRYNPEHPEIAYVGGRVWMGVILLGMGILFVLAATLGFVNGGDGPRTAGRKLASGLLLGFIITCMGWGIIPLLGDEVHVISVPGIVLSLFGIMGIVAMVKSVKDYIAVKTGKASEVQDRSRSSQYQYEANARMTMSWDGNGAVDNPVTDFYREHKEGIDTTIRTVQKGRNIVGNIVMIAVGGIFTFSALLMIGGNILVLMANRDSGMVSLPAYIMPIVMEGIFLAVGIFVIVKGIKGLI